METTKQEQPVTDQDRFVRGLYRNIGELARNVKLLAIALERSFGPIKVEVNDETPVQADLPGIAQQDTADLPSGLRWVNEPGVAYKPGDIAKEIAKTWQPRIWGSTVNFYNEAWMLFKGNAFILAELFDHREELTRATHGKVHLASFQRVLSALVRAGAATRKGGAYTLREPNDEIREAVEHARSKRKEVAA